MNTILENFLKLDGTVTFRYLIYILTSSTEISLREYLSLLKSKVDVHQQLHNDLMVRASHFGQSN
jgi:hypothetical protein